ncbi:aspartate--ammonia ligase [Mycoplasmopsis agassizii]|uniref:Aspartate--ammonia ligase n=1 Tax=Mycoplasmopsis agassizii TaxID=33922 RepID=A0ABX4H542_9BACT|nr:aspartate--ammonia ligase [Mycoplasmopsis agassizii]PAF55016.1 aspartate--ammonia ligase [Mycoplasmopsis agassizii]SMC17533.1 aspartate-ammonia ligase [Mycoplasmopsis agassizii]
MYKTKLDINQTQVAIGLIKSVFPKYLSQELHLTRATAPLFLDPKTGLNDGLNGETPVSFQFKNIDTTVEIVHSLAKWKRHSLKVYEFQENTGIYTDMNAIRRAEDLDEVHSFYVDQWDWEKVINVQDRNLNYLKMTVKSIYHQIKRMEYLLKSEYYNLEIKLPDELTFITSQELEDLYPDLSPEQREHQFARKVKAFFVIGVGYNLKSGVKHSGRAFDYDDWNLNGDLIVYHPVLDRALELSSMGIRVDSTSIVKQANKSSAEVASISPYHQGVIENKLPLTIGGGIGQSRLCMFLLEKAHIGEVQVSYWSEAEIKTALDKGIKLL